jgi:acyl transferase domain-containing protein
MLAKPRIAIIGLACEFPGANTPSALWETALLKRRWFRDLRSTQHVFAEPQ